MSTEPAAAIASISILHADVGRHALRRDRIALVLLLVGREIGGGAGAVAFGLVGARIADDRDAFEILGAERFKRLERVAGADQQDRGRLEALFAHGAQQQVAVRHVAGVDPDVGRRALGAQDRVGQVDGAEVMRADADDGRAFLLQHFLLPLGDRGAVDRVFAFDPDLQALDRLAERGREQVA